MDVHTKRNLELTESLRLKDRNYSLLWLLDNTKTAMGSRKLKQWIEAPLKEKRLIEKRYNIVSKLIEEFILSEDLRSNLYEVYDLERLSGRIALGNANARDMISLKNSLAKLPNVKSILNNTKSDYLKELYENLDELEDIYELIEEAIVDEPPMTIKEGGLIKIGYNKVNSIFFKLFFNFN